MLYFEDPFISEQLPLASNPAFTAAGQAQMTHLIVSQCFRPAVILTSPIHGTTQLWAAFENLILF